MMHPDYIADKIWDVGDELQKLSVTVQGHQFQTHKNCKATMSELKHLESALQSIRVAVNSVSRLVEAGE